MLFSNRFYNSVCDKKISKKIKKAVLIIAICIYAGVSVYWVRTSNVPPVDDSKSVNNLAISFVNRRY